MQRSHLIKLYTRHSMKHATPKRQLPIVFAADANFSIPFGIAVMTLLEHARPETFYDIYVLDDGIRDEVKREVAQFQEKYDFSITYYDVSEMVKDMPSTCIFPPIMYARFLVPRLLPQKVQNRIFYIDADVLFCDDLTELYDMDLAGKPFAATQALNMTAYGNRRYLKWLGNAYGMNFFEKGKPYFHSGEMLFDRQEWMKAGFTERCLKMAQEPFPKEILYHDQDFMNIVCRGQIANFPAKYCVIPLFEKRYICDYDYTYEGLSLYSEEELRRAHEKPAIIHYAGTKPIVFRGPAYKNEASFFEAWARSPWKNRIPYFPRTMLTMQAKPERRAILENLQTRLPENSVSVIVHTDNLIRKGTADSFIDCIDTLHRQSLEHLEIIIIDNNSTDGTRDLLQKYTELGILRYISADVSCLWDAYNMGLELARGSYLLFLQTTDSLNSSTSLEKLVKTAIAHAADVTCCTCDIRDSAGHTLHSMTAALPPTEYAIPAILCSSLFRTQKLRETGGFAPDTHPHCTEYALFAKLVRKDAVFCTNNDCRHSTLDTKETNHGRKQQAWLQEITSLLKQQQPSPSLPDSKEAKVAILVSLLQPSQHFQTLLLSLQKQSLSDIQIIIIGSSATTEMQYARDAASTDSRILCLDCPDDYKCGQAYNLGLSKARAEYVAFVPNNDFITPNFYSLLYDKAISTNYSVVKGTSLLLKDAGFCTDLQFNSTITAGLRNGKRLSSLFNKESYSAIYKREYIAQRNAAHSDSMNLDDDGYFLVQILLHLPISHFSIEEQAIYFHREKSQVLSDNTPGADFLSRQQPSTEAKVHYLLTQKEINSPSIIGTLSDIFEVQLGCIIEQAQDSIINRTALIRHLQSLAELQQQWKHSPTTYKPETLATAFEAMGFYPEQFLSHKSAYCQIARQEATLIRQQKEIATHKNELSEHKKTQLRFNQELDTLRQQLRLMLLMPQLQKKYHLLKLKKFFSWGSRRKRYKQKLAVLRVHIRTYRQFIRQNLNSLL